MDKSHEVLSKFDEYKKKKNMQNKYANLMVSVGVITYNHEEFIHQALESILSQKCNFQFEVIIGDDCSQDKTQNIILDYEKKFSNKIKTHLNNVNKGLLANFKFVTDNCNGKYITICAGDDYWNDPYKLQKQVDFLEANPDFGLVHSNVYLLKNDSVITPKKRYIPEGSIFTQIIIENNFIYALTACYRTELFRKHVNIDEFIENGFLTEDLPLWIELSRVTKFHYLDDKLATYRIHENSLSNSSDFKKVEKLLWSTYEIRKYYIKKYSFVYNEEIVKQKLYYKLIKIAFLSNNFHKANKYSQKLQCSDLKIKSLTLLCSNKYIFNISYSLYYFLNFLRLYVLSLRFRLIKN